MLKRILVLCVVMAFALPGMAQLDVTLIGPESTGYFTTVIDDARIYDNGVQNQSNWEMYSGVFVDGTLASVTNTEAEGDFAGVTERGVAIWYTPFPDNQVQERAGFLQDDGAPWTNNNDIARTDGNMPRIACQVIAGQEDNDVYMFGNECTPWAYPGQFPSYGSGFAYDSQVASVQILIRGANGDPTKVTNVFDPTYGDWTTGSQGGQQIRFGGSVRMLSNGNFVAIQEDRAGAVHPIPGSRCSATSVWDQTGTKIVEPFCAQVPKDPLEGIGIWDNVAAFDGGFAIRNEAYEGNNGLTFFANDGSYMGFWAGISEGATTTNIANWSGSNERVSGHVTKDFVDMVGRGAGGAAVYCTRVQASNQTTLDEVNVSGGYNVAIDRCEVCTDKDGNVFVAWADSNNTGNKQLIGRLFDDNLDPVTDPFLVFNESELTASSGFAGKHPSCQMVKQSNGSLRVMVSQRTDGPAPSLGLNTNDHLAIVFEGPPEQVDDWELY